MYRLKCAREQKQGLSVIIFKSSLLLNTDVVFPLQHSTPEGDECEFLPYTHPQFGTFQQRYSL